MSSGQYVRRVGGVWHFVDKSDRLIGPGTTTALSSLSPTRPPHLYFTQKHRRFSFLSNTGIRPVNGHFPYLNRLTALKSWNLSSQRFSHSEDFTTYNYTIIYRICILILLLFNNSIISISFLARFR